MKKTKGFTLIELLVVIAIIAILTSIVTANFSESRKKARDAKRVSDLAQMQLVLEYIFDKCRIYPAYPINTTSTICTADGVTYTWNTFASNFPKDPTTGIAYSYTSNFSKLDYVLKTTLETDSIVLDDDVDGTVQMATNSNGSSFINVICDETSSQFNYCVKPK